MRLLVTILLSAFFVTAEGQTNYSGRYGYTESIKSLNKRIPETKGRDESGFHQELLLLKIAPDRYKFWFYLIKGYPSYNSGSIEGIIQVSGDSGTFHQKDTVVASDDCRLLFRFQKAAVTIEQQEGNCGFGANVGAPGEYSKIGKRLPSTKDIVNSGGGTREKLKVVAEKTIIYTDDKLKLSNNQYFIKGDVVYSFDHTNDAVYIQHITGKGKFVEGWIKKKDLVSLGWTDTE